MSDHGDAAFRGRPSGVAHAAVRDALPALLHGRVSAVERVELEGHLAACHACDAEFRMLAAVRDLYAVRASTAPVARAVSVGRIAAAVRARTLDAPATPETAPIVRAMAVPTRRAPAWVRRGMLRAFAASALVALGTGAIVVHRPATTPANAARVANAPNMPSDALRDPNGSLLGANFSDLSDAELAAVVAVVDDPAASAPAAEPAPVAPSVLAPDAE